MSILYLKGEYVDTDWIDEEIPYQMDKDDKIHSFKEDTKAQQEEEESYFDEDKGIVLSEEVKEIFKECEEKMPF